MEVTPEEFAEQDDAIAAVESEDETNTNRFESDEEGWPDEEVEVVDIKDKLAKWSTDFYISDDAMDDLLSYLKKYHFPHLPKTNKSLKADAKLKDVPVTRMDDGEFCYFGLSRALEYILIKNLETQNIADHYDLQFGIDGVPLTKSSKGCFWPTLVKIKSFVEVLPVAVYYGINKPKSIHDYMADFVLELDQILKNGIRFNGLQIFFSVDAFIMDAPAKAFVLDIKVCLIATHSTEKSIT